MSELEMFDNKYLLQYLLMTPVCMMYIFKYKHHIPSVTHYLFSGGVVSVHLTFYSVVAISEVDTITLGRIIIIVLVRTKP